MGAVASYPVDTGGGEYQQLPCCRTGVPGDCSLLMLPRAEIDCLSIMGCVRAYLDHQLGRGSAPNIPLMPHRCLPLF